MSVTTMSISVIHRSLIGNLEETVIRSVGTVELGYRKRISLGLQGQFLSSGDSYIKNLSNHVPYGSIV